MSAVGHGYRSVVKQPMSVLERVQNMAVVRTSLAEVAWAVLGASAFRDFEVAVGEVVTNALVHGEEPVTVRMWAEPGAVVVTVHDRGAGPSDPLLGRLPPNASRSGGFGLWIARNWSDSLEISVDGDGCTVRLVVRARPG